MNKQVAVGLMKDLLLYLGDERSLGSFSIEEANGDFEIRLLLPSFSTGRVREIEPIVEKLGFALCKSSNAWFIYDPKATTVRC